MLRDTTTLTGPSPVAFETPPASVSFSSPPGLDHDHASTTAGSSDAVKMTDWPVLVTSRTCRPGGVMSSSPTCSRHVAPSDTAHNSSPPSSQAGTPPGQSTQAASLTSRRVEVGAFAQSPFPSSAPPPSSGTSTASTAAALWSRCSTNSKGGPQRLQCTATRYGNLELSQVTWPRRASLRGHLHVPEADQRVCGTGGRVTVRPGRAGRLRGVSRPPGPDRAVVGSSGQ